MSNTNQLIKVIENKINTWNERSNFTIKGIKNISRSDLDTILLYINSYTKSSERNFGGLVPPTGYVKDVLDKFNIVIEH